VRDELDLPEKLPAQPKSEGVRIKSPRKSTAKRETKTLRESATKPRVGKRDR
jgi:hypothetical protein